MIFIPLKLLISITHLQDSGWSWWLMMLWVSECLIIMSLHYFSTWTFLHSSHFSHSLFLCPLILSHLSYLLSKPPIFTFSHCSSLICKTAHLARRREWWEEMSRSTTSSRPSHWNVKWPSGVEVEGWRDGGMNGRRSGERQERLCSIVYFLKMWLFFFFLMIILIPPRTSQPEPSALSPPRSHSLIKTQSQATNSNKPSASSLKKRRWGRWKCRLQ